MKGEPVANAPVTDLRPGRRAGIALHRMSMTLPRPLDACVAALQQVELAGAGFFPWLDENATAGFARDCAALDYRAARPLVGTAGREVRQDFELTMAIPPVHPLRDLAAELAELTLAGLARLTPNPLPQGLVYNDLIVQRYAAGSAGITSHRDHIRYVGLVALVTLAGDARFFLCDDRAGSNPREFGMAAGGVTLMRAPGFAGSATRPFHYVSDIRQPRLSLGLRHDTRPGEPT